VSKIRQSNSSGGLLLRVTGKDGRSRPRIKKAAIHDQTAVEPHQFERLGFFRRNQCRHCYLAEHAHPVIFWSLAR
jgi:hypothetical protein